MVEFQHAMSSSIGLDVKGAVESFKTLTGAVKASTSEWKANELAARHAGDYQKAQETKVAGLTKSVQLQQKALADLKQRQSEVDVSTEKGTTTYYKLGAQIANAGKKLDGMTSQLETAKGKLGYYTSGLSELQKGYRQSAQLSDSYVDRLKAEGKQDDANKEKLSGLRSGYSNLNDQLKIQESELEKLASATGKSSNAYKLQQQRVNETATDLAKTKTQITELNSEMGKNHGTFLNNFSSKFGKVNEQAEKTSHLFAKITGANLLASGITNALSAIQAHFSSLQASVSQFNDKQQTMNATWTTLTSSASKGKAMVDMGNQLASAYNQDINVVDELNQQFYHVLDAKRPTEELTKSVLTLGDTLNLSNENVDRLGTNFTHMMSSGKVQLGDFNMINDQLPMFAENMLKYEQHVQNNSKLSMSQLRKEMSAGKINAKDAEAVMNSLGKKYQSASENLMKTPVGMQRSIATQMPALLDRIYKPIANMRNPLLGSITKWIGDKKTKSEFSSVGKELATQISRITKAFGGNKINIAGGLDKFLDNVRGAIEKLGDAVVKNKGSIKDFIGAMKTSAVTSWKIFVQVLKDLSPVLKIVGSLAAKFPKQFAFFMTTGLILSKTLVPLASFAGGLSKIVDLGKKAKGLFVVKDAVTGTKNLTKLGSAFKTVGSTLGSGFTKFSSMFMKLGKFMLTNPIGIVITAVGVLAIAFIELYKHCKPFRDFINGIGKAIAKAFGSVPKILGNVGNWFKKVFTGIINFFKKDWKEIALFLVSPIAGGIALAYKHIKPFRNFINGLVSFFKKVFSKIWNNVQSFFSTFGKGWNNFWKSVGKFLSKSWDNMIKGASDWGSSIGKWFSKFGSNFSKGWHSFWSGIGKFLQNIWDGIVKGVKGGFNGVIGIINDVIGSINNVWKFFTKHNAIGYLKKLAAGGVITAEQRLVMVNDDGSADPRELIQLPNGIMGMFQGRNQRAVLPVGTRVYNSKETKNIFNNAGIQHYADGGWIGNIGKTIGNATNGLVKGTESLIGGAWSKATAIGKWLAKPAEFVGNMINTALKGASAGTSGMTMFAEGVINKLTSSIVAWFKRKLTGLDDQLNITGKVSGHYNPALIRKAAAIDHVSPSDNFVRMLEAVIMSESGGRNIMQQIQDINTATGNPAGGILQYTKSTFGAYARPGYTNWLNPLDQLVAFFNNSDWQNSIGWTSIWGHRKVDWLHSGPQGGRRYANGGWANQASIFGESGLELAVPMNNTNRAITLLGQAVNVLRAKTGMKPEAETSSVSESKIDLMINLLSQLVQGQSQPTYAVISDNSVFKAVKDHQLNRQQFKQQFGI